MKIVFPELEPLPAPIIWPENDAKLNDAPPAQLTAKEALEALERISAQPNEELAKATAAQIAAGRRVQIVEFLKLSDRVTMIPSGWQFNYLDIADARVPVLNHVTISELKLDGNQTLKQIGPNIKSEPGTDYAGQCVTIKNGASGLTIDLHGFAFEAEGTKFGAVNLNMGSIVRLKDCQSELLCIRAANDVTLDYFQSPKAEIVSHANLVLMNACINDLSAVTGRDIWNRNCAHRGSFQTMQLKAAGEVYLTMSSENRIRHIEDDTLRVGSVRIAAERDIYLNNSSVEEAEIFTNRNLELNETNNLRRLRAAVEGKAFIVDSSVAEITRDSFARGGWKIANTPNLKEYPSDLAIANSLPIRRSIEEAFALNLRSAASPAAEPAAIIAKK